MARKRGGKTLIITDDEGEEERAEELNPFSFKEFLRWRDTDQELNQSLEKNEEDDWGHSFLSEVDSSSSLCTEEEETRFSSKPEDDATGEGDNYEGDDEISMAEVFPAPKRSSLIDQLKEENMLLKRTIRDLQQRAENNHRRASELSEELLQRRRQEEKEAQDLESMVHSVEQNLHLMTRRAVKAENSVSKLKVELQQMQVEMDSLRSENNRLKTTESQVIMTMRQNAQVASEYLNKTASNAHSSIRQLLSEAETLHLVSQLLHSIDKMSTVHTES